MQKIFVTLLTLVLFTVLAMPAYAHGGEDAVIGIISGLSGRAIAILSVIVAGIAAAGSWLFFRQRFQPVQYAVVGLTVITAVIHIFVGNSDGELILMLNGLGYVGLLAALYFLPLGPLENLRIYLIWILMGYTVLTIGLYFVSHPWGYDGNSLDRLGLMAKAAELLLLVALAVEVWQPTSRSNASLEAV